MEKQNYIGRKVKGFSFDDEVHNVAFRDEMLKHVGEIGVITKYDEDNLSFRVEFDDDYWFYPASLIDQYIVHEEQDDTELRDQFAMQAMNALLMHYGFRESNELLSKNAYLIADAMLKSRKEVKGE